MFLWAPMNSKAQSLREMLGRPRPVVVAGAHDALSSKLIEEAGFDAVWASGFGISASLKCLPDANYLTLTENLQMAVNMNEAVKIPIIADCDNGYGNALNVMRTVMDYERSGIAGICIEDNIFPKKCSFYPGFQRELVSISEMQGRIRAGKSIQKNPDFVLIARTEALISGWGMEEALARARAFAEAGADAILIHSKSKSPDEVIQFSKRWESSIPLVVVPTVYDSVTVEELGKAGFKVVILANQALRASIKAMRSALSKMCQMGCARSVASDIATLEEVYELVGVSEMKQAEDQFLPGAEAIKAVIVSAGFEKHLLPLIQDRPKSMLDIKGKTILERQIGTLNECHIKDIIVVRGYKRESIQIPGVRYYDNSDYEQSYILSSFFCAEPEFKGRIIFIYGDVLFEKSVLEKLLQSPADISLVVDRAWTDSFKNGEIPEGSDRELVLLKDPAKMDYRYVSSGENLSILKIGQNLERREAHAEFIGLAMFSAQGIETLRQVHERLKNVLNGDAFHEARDFKMASLTDMIQELIDQGHSVSAVDIYKGWMEIDTFEDYQRAWAQLK